MMRTPKIESDRRWDGWSVREMCVKHNLYTRGDCRAYEKMLAKVGGHHPTHANMWKVAKDIVEHSNTEDWGDEIESITAVLFLLEDEAVKTYFRVIER